MKEMIVSGLQFVKSLLAYLGLSTFAAMVDTLVANTALIDQIVSWLTPHAQLMKMAASSIASSIDFNQIMQLVQLVMSILQSLRS